MSDNIPIEIQSEIIKRLPIKSLIQFQSVCKAWKTLIASSDFINHYSCQLQQHHLLVRYEDPLDYNHNYVSFVDDHTFPHQKLSHTAPLLVKNLLNPRIIAASHGLLCLYSHYPQDTIVIWNISIRKAIAVVRPSSVRGWMYGTTIGFGLCRETGDPKIVKVTFVDQDSKVRMESETSCVAPIVEVFTLSAGVWRSSHGNLPRRSVHFFPFNGAVIDGVYYWLATDEITVDGGYKYMIVSFDMTTEEFGEVVLPDSLAYMGLDLSKLGESLVVVGSSEHERNPSLDVWMMGDGVPKSFTKLFTFTLTADDVFLGFRKSGEPIIEILIEIPKQGETCGEPIIENPEQGETCGELATYEPYSKRIDTLGIDGISGTFDAFDYKETLLLLDQPNLMVYNGI